MGVFQAQNSIRIFYNQKNMIFGTFFENIRLYPLFLGPKHTIYNLINTLFFHRSLDNILKLLLDPKKVGVRGGEGILPLNLKKKNYKNAKFTKKKLSHPNYCYLSFKALDMGAHTVLDF